MKQKNDDSEVVTKGYLRQELQDMEVKLDGKAKDYRDQILTKLDEVMGELATLREENMIGAHQTRELRDAVEDHDKRITRIERLQKAA